MEIEDYKYLETKLFIKHFRGCNQCPHKVYAKANDTITFGIGNINSDIFIILPSYDIKYKKDYKSLLKILRDTYTKLTNKELFDEAYITRSIKCFTNTSYDVNSTALNYCAFHIKYEVGRIKPKKVIIFDRLCYDLFDGMFPNFDIYTLYSPAVMFYDNNKLKDTFIKEFKCALGYDS